MNKPFVPERVVSEPPLSTTFVSARFSGDEFLNMSKLGAFHGMKLELSHGELIRMTPPHRSHAAVLARLITRLSTTVSDAEILAEAAIRLDENTIRGLDAAIVAPGGETPVLQPEQVRLAVEVADSTLEFDLGEKARDYAGGRIPLYWVVDVNARATHVMSDPQEGSYVKREVVRFGEPLSLPNGQGSITLD